VGMDLSVEMLHAAQQRGFQSVDLVRADASALPCRAGAFDLVFMSHVLLLIADLDVCLAGVERVLRPGGVLIATVGASGWPEIIRRLLGAERIHELEAAFGSVSVGARRDEPTAVAAACQRSGLQPTWRQADFAVSWPALEEWVRVRWLSIVDEALRVRADRWLVSIRSRAGAGMLQMAETLLVAHKRPGGRIADPAVELSDS
jgi:SAM-dependent methyltransferase